jgi:hypothetical protein
MEGSYQCPGCGGSIKPLRGKKEMIFYQDNSNFITRYDLISFTNSLVKDGVKVQHCPNSDCPVERVNIDKY